MTLTPLTRAIAKINEAHDEEVVLDLIGFASAAWLVLAQLDQALNEFDLVIGSWFLLMGAFGAFDYSARSARDRASHAELSLDAWIEGIRLNPRS